MNKLERELDNKLTELSEQGLKVLEKNKPLYKRLRKGDVSVMAEIAQLDQDEMQPIRVEILKIHHKICEARKQRG